MSAYGCKAVSMLVAPMSSLIAETAKSGSSTLTQFPIIDNHLLYANISFMTKAISNPIIGTMFAVMLALLGQVPVYADSTSPRLAAYYDLKMLMCGQAAYQWKGNNRPIQVATDVIQVGVGRDASYVLQVPWCLTLE